MTFNSEKKIQDIVRDYEEARSKGETPFMDSDDLSRLSDYYQDRGRMDKALEVADYTLGIYPGAAQPLAFKSRAALLIDHDVEKAQQLVDQIEDQTDLEYYYARAEVMVYQGNLDEADSYLEQVYDGLSDDNDRMDFVLDVARLYADYDELDLAGKWVDRSDETDDLDYREVKGRIALNNGEYDKAEAIFKHLIDDDPYSGFYWNKLATIQMVKCRYDEAVQSSEYAIAINPNDDEAILLKAKALQALGNYTDAMEFFRRYGNLFPDDPMADINIGASLVGLGKFAEALKQIKAALTKLGDNSDLGVWVVKEIVFCLMQLGRNDEALKYVDWGEERFDDPESLLEVTRGHIYMGQDLTEEARQCFQKALETSGNPPSTALHIAVSVYECGYIQLAYSMFHNLLDELVDEMTDGLAFMANCARELGKEEEYLDLLRLACERNPNEAHNIFGDYFPEDIQPQDYYRYALAHRNDKKKD